MNVYAGYGQNRGRAAASLNRKRREGLHAVRQAPTSMAADDGGGARSWMRDFEARAVGCSTGTGWSRASRCRPSSWRACIYLPRQR